MPARPGSGKTSPREKDMRGSGFEGCRYRSLLSLNQHGYIRQTGPSPTVTLVRNDPVNTACRTLIEESIGCEDDQATLQGAQNRSC